MKWLGIKRKPCAVVLGNFVYGNVQCYHLTHSRLVVKCDQSGKLMLAPMCSGPHG